MTYKCQSCNEIWVQTYGQWRSTQRTAVIILLPGITLTVCESCGGELEETEPLPEVDIPITSGLIRKGEVFFI